MVEGVAVVNASERVLFSNPSFASVLGLGFTAAAGKRTGGSCSPDGIDRGRPQSSRG